MWFFNSEESKLPFDIPFPFVPSNHSGKYVRVAAGGLPQLLPFVLPRARALSLISLRLHGHSFNSIRLFTINVIYLFSIYGCIGITVLRTASHVRAFNYRNVLPHWGFFELPYRNTLLHWRFFELACRRRSPAKVTYFPLWPSNRCIVAIYINGGMLSCRLITVTDACVAPSSFVLCCAVFPFFDIVLQLLIVFILVAKCSN